MPITQPRASASRFFREMPDDLDWGIDVEIMRSPLNRREKDAWNDSFFIDDDLSAPDAPLFTIYEGDAFSLTLYAYEKASGARVFFDPDLPGLSRGSTVGVEGFDGGDRFALNPEIWGPPGEDRGIEGRRAYASWEQGTAVLHVSTGGERWSWGDAETGFDYGNGSATREVKMLDVFADIRNPYYNWSGASAFDDSEFDGEINFLLLGRVRYVDLADGVSNGADRLKGSGKGETIRSGGGDDVVFGRGGDDFLYGQKGGDKLIGGAGKDRLFGQGGRDDLRGGGGRDRLDGEAGDDRMKGGGGADLFVLDRNDGRDVLLDFDPSQDSILIENGARRFGQLDLDDIGRDVTVKFGKTTAILRGVDLEDLTKGDFLFG